MPKRKQVEKPHNNGTWSDARKKSFIVSALRRASGRWGPKYTCIKNSRVARGKYLCSSCQAIVGPKAIRADHIEPVVGVDGWIDWNTFIERLFVEKEGYASICKECHNKKSKIENAQRKTNKQIEMFAIMPPLPEVRNIRPPGGSEVFP